MLTEPTGAAFGPPLQRDNERKTNELENNRRDRGHDDRLGGGC